MATTKRTGGTRMSDLGYKPIQLWLGDVEMRTLKAIAKEEERPMTQVLVRLLRAAGQKLSRRKLPLFEK